MKYKGIGKVKAVQLKALSEIIKRASIPIIDCDIKIKCPRDLADIIMSTLRFETIEELKVALIDTKGNLKNIVSVQKGSMNTINVESRDVFKEAIKQDISRIIIIHNHPSGDPTPSKEDINFTLNMQKIGKDLGIEVLDHIIIGDGIFKSVLEYISNIDI